MFEVSWTGWKGKQHTRVATTPNDVNAILEEVWPTLRRGLTIMVRDNTTGQYKYAAPPDGSATVFEGPNKWT
jgi:hypothetical protein